MTKSRKVFIAVTSVATLLLAAAPAQAAPRITTVMSGLDNPRGLAFGLHGELFVAEAGRGGSGPCQAGPEGGTECFGTSGAITRFAYGVKKRVAHNLPSLASPDGTQALGPSDVAVDEGGDLLWTVGLGGNPEQSKFAGMAKLYGDGDVVADIGRFEKTANPDGVKPPDTNPNSVLATRDGALVVDAGGNDLVRVSQRGRISTVAVFPGPAKQGPAKQGPSKQGPSKQVQAVPTSVVRGPDGAFYVGELTGFPFTKGTAVVWRVVPGHAPTVYAAGLTNVIDLAWGPDRRLYVLEIAENGLASGDQTGALLRIDRHGHAKVIADEGLTAPGGLVVRGRYAYVSNCSVCAGKGEVVRVSL